MPRLERVGARDEIRPGERKHVILASNEEITLFRLGDDLIALRNRCPHANARLGDGEVQGSEIVCPLHRWRFDLRTGIARRDRRTKAQLYRVVLDGDDILVELPADEGDNV